LGSSIPGTLMRWRSERVCPIPHFIRRSGLTQTPRYQRK
jgi:hypothetical protein